jgi:hypothetical protein
MASWFRSYLTDRKQNNEIKSLHLTQNTYSNWGTMKLEVPQGSVLGSLLFLIYIKDPPPALNSSIPIIFADDRAGIA